MNYRLAVASLLAIAGTGCGDKLPDCSAPSVRDLGQQLAQDAVLQASKDAANRRYGKDSLWASLRQTYAPFLPGGTAGFDMIAPAIKNMERMKPFLDTGAVRVSLQDLRLVEKKADVRISICEATVTSEGQVAFGFDATHMLDVEDEPKVSDASQSAREKLAQLEGAAPAKAAEPQLPQPAKVDEFEQSMMLMADSLNRAASNQGRTLKYDSTSKHFYEVMEPWKFPSSTMRFSAQFIDDGKKVVVKILPTNASQ